MSLGTATVFKNSNVLTVIHLAFLRKDTGVNVKVFRYRIWTSVKRSEKYLSSKTQFTTFLQVSRSSFRLKLC